MTQPKLVPVILSGGAGSRLWPISRAALPKQFQALVGEETLFIQTLNRVSEFEGAETCPSVIVTGAAHGGLVQGQLSEAGQEGAIVLEPEGRNTAPAAAFACHCAIEAHGDDALVLILPSDHHIGMPEKFRAAVSAALSLAEDGALVTFGITPDGPETGYGYIKRGAPLGAGFAIERFIEKPPLEEAKAMLSSGGHDWNAGIFLFRAKRFLDELAMHAPDMAVAVASTFASRIEDEAGITPHPDTWAAIQGDSIDYAVMQKTTRAAVVPVSMAWSDVGGFNALWQLSPKDASENAAPEGTAFIDASGNYVISRTGRQIALVGVMNSVIIDTEDALVIVPREKAQSIKALVQWLKQNGHERLL